MALNPAPCEQIAVGKPREARKHSHSSSQGPRTLPAWPRPLASKLPARTMNPSLLQPRWFPSWGLLRIHCLGPLAHAPCGDLVRVTRSAFILTANLHLPDPTHCWPPSWHRAGVLGAPEHIDSEAGTRPSLPQLSPSLMLGPLSTLLPCPDPCPVLFPMPACCIAFATVSGVAVTHSTPP